MRLVLVEEEIHKMRVGRGTFVSRASRAGALWGRSGDEVLTHVREMTLGSAHTVRRWIQALRDPPNVQSNP